MEPELRLYARSLPTSHRAEVQVTLRPGSAIYVPNAMWHATETLEDSLALNLHFWEVPATDTAAKALRNLLLQVEALREPLPLHVKDTRRWDDALDQCRGLLANASAADLFDLDAPRAPLRPTGSVVRNPLTAVFRVHRDDAEAHYEVTPWHLRSGHLLKASRPLGEAIIDHVMTLNRPVRVPALLERFGRQHRAEALEFLDKLSATGVLRVL